MSKEEYGRIMAEIETLPGGGITYKKINGREYAYYQWREAGRQHSRRAKGDSYKTDRKKERTAKSVETNNKRGSRRDQTGLAVSLSGEDRGRTGPLCETCVRVEEAGMLSASAGVYLWRYAGQGVYFIRSAKDREDNADPSADL